MTFDPAAQGWTSWQSMGFTDLAGPFWYREDKGQTIYGFIAGGKHLNRGGIVHGGMLATFADIVMGRTAYGRIKPRSCATVQLNMHYVSAVQPGSFVTGRAEVIRVTNSLVFLQGRCEGDGAVLATADGVWKILAEGRRLNAAEQRAGAR